MFKWSPEVRAMRVERYETYSRNQKNQSQLEEGRHLFRDSVPALAVIAQPRSSHESCLAWAGNSNPLSSSACLVGTIPLTLARHRKRRQRFSLSLTALIHYHAKYQVSRATQAQNWDGDLSSSLTEHACFPNWETVQWSRNVGRQWLRWTESLLQGDAGLVPYCNNSLGPHTLQVRRLICKEGKDRFKILPQN